MAAQIWDEMLGPLVVQYWASVSSIITVAKAKGLTNAQVQTLATGVLGEISLVGNTTVSGGPGLGNAAAITAAAGLAANNWS
jgi:hypothetical protein